MSALESVDCLLATNGIGDEIKWESIAKAWRSIKLKTLCASRGTALSQRAHCLHGDPNIWPLSSLLICALGLIMA